MGTIVLDEKYRVDTCVAMGGQATIYKVTHRLGGTFAMKCCTAADPTEHQRFLDQGYISNQIPSAHVLRALDDGRTLDGSPYLIFPFVVGQNADERCITAGGRLPPRDVVAIACQALAALHAAHKMGIVHRDLKPENLLIGKDGHVYVIDWGAASFRAHLGTRTAAASLAPITPAYTAPEQARGDEATMRSDLFGIGATMYSLLAGCSPRTGSSPLSMLIEAATHPLMRLRDVVPDVSAELAAVVDRATAFEAGERYPSTAAMWVDLRSVYRRM